MDPRLQQAIEHDDVDELHRFIVEEPKLLDRACKGPFPNTPLHIAAAAGKTQVAIEMAILKPSFARILNPEGYSPMHLALQHEHYQTARALMKFDPKLIRVRGRRGITPLHYLTEKEGDNELELLAEFLTACKSSIEDLTSQCETAVHVAVKNHNLKAFKVLFGWLKRVYLTKILDWKDQDGNTVLHIAISEKQPEIIKLLIGYTSIDAKNFQDKTALEIFLVNPSGDQSVAKRLRWEGRRAKYFAPTLSLSQFFGSDLDRFEKLACSFGIRYESARNIIFLMSVLMVIFGFQYGLTLLEGYWQNSSLNPTANSTVVATNSSGTATGKPHHAGNLIPEGWLLYTFVALIILAIFALLKKILAFIMTLLPYARKDYCVLAYGILAFSKTFPTFPEPIEIGGVPLWNITSTRK
ncbi:ankyrin repeat-containing protein BDA1-like [Syzygium oleosum]|uniref:ankyrin repeat-containing protein BDA1-like n=1 Tax=Syzygium oleosum TaxID=219896 RepID=UPI0024B9FFF9|nr:ankyrin repeat-containing protein BDA1-like [Syzygium oleosum]